MPSRIPRSPDPVGDGLGSAGPAKCLIPGCQRLAAPGYGRGLCVRCYGRAKKLVEAGEYTWERLAEIGMAQDAEDDPFDRALRKAAGRDADGTTAG